MKNLLLLIIVLFSSCKSKHPNGFKLTEPIFEETLNCPPNGTCAIELIPNKLLEFKQDEFGNSYPLISEGEKTILKYTYKKNTDKSLQDSNYTEIIYAELGQTITDISLTSKELQSTKLHFGRLCYCKGETGYYPITNGNFNIKKSGEDALEVTLEFKINEVPQIISKISEIVSLKSNATN